MNHNEIFLLFWVPFLLGLLVFTYVGWKLILLARTLYAVGKTSARPRINVILRVRACVTLILPLFAFVAAAWLYWLLLQNNDPVRDFARHAVAIAYFLFLSPALFISFFVRGIAGFLLSVWGGGTAYPGDWEDFSDLGGGGDSDGGSGDSGDGGD